MIPLLPLMLIGGVALLGILSLEAKDAADELRTKNYQKARVILTELQSFKPEILKELYSKRNKLSPLVAQNLERFFEEKRG